MRVALEMIPTSVDVLGIDIPKDLPNNRETVMPSNDSTSQGMVNQVWARMRGGMWTNRDHLPKWAQGRREAWARRQRY